MAILINEQKVRILAQWACELAQAQILVVLESVLLVKHKHIDERK